MIRIAVIKSTSKGPEVIVDHVFSIEEVLSTSATHPYEYRIKFEEPSEYTIYVYAMKNGVVVDALVSHVKAIELKPIQAVLVTDRKSYCLNDTIIYTIINKGDEPLATGNPCISARLYRWNGTAWELVKPKGKIMCTLEGYPIYPGTAKSFKIDLNKWSKLYTILPGKYKLVVEVYGDVSKQQNFLKQRSS